MNQYTNPTVASFQTYFFRDFVYGSTNNSVQPIDITNALQDAIAWINPQLFITQQVYTIGCLNLAAHFLVENLRGASQGINGQYPWLLASKSAGPTSQSSSIPPEILNDPQLALLTTTRYGAKYLSLVYSGTRGNAMVLCARTNP